MGGSGGSMGREVVIGFGPGNDARRRGGSRGGCGCVLTGAKGLESFCGCKRTMLGACAANLADQGNAIAIWRVGGLRAIRARDGSQSLSGMVVCTWESNGAGGAKICLELSCAWKYQFVPTRGCACNAGCSRRSTEFLSCIPRVGGRRRSTHSTRRAAGQQGWLNVISRDLASSASTDQGSQASKSHLDPLVLKRGAPPQSRDALAPPVRVDQCPQ
jgi:hypothetical protein